MVLVLVLVVVRGVLLVPLAWPSCVCVCVCVGGLRWLGLGHVKMMMELGREAKQNTFPFHLHQKPKVDDRYHHAR